MINLHKELNLQKEYSSNKFSMEMKPFYIEAARRIQSEDCELLRRIKKPHLDQDLQNQFIVSGIPAFAPQKKDKFLAVFNKLCSQKKIGVENGLLRTHVNFGDGKEFQTLYLTYKSVGQAKIAFYKLNNLKFSKQNTLNCYFIRQILLAVNAPEQMHTPTYIPHSLRHDHNFQEQGRNQFLLRDSNLLYLKWLDHLDKSAPTLDTTELEAVNKVQFSPLGSYIVVCFTQGIYLYAGALRKGPYTQEHPSVIKFSPNEEYMVSSNAGLLRSRENVVIWGVEAEVKLKSFKIYQQQLHLNSFQFSWDSKSLALINGNEILFYNIQAIEQFKAQLQFGEEESNKYKTNHLQQVMWLRNNTCIMCVCYEQDYDPKSPSSTKVIVYDTVNKVEKKWRAWNEHVKNGEIVLSEKGTWVAVVLKKFTKKNHFATVIQVGNLMRSLDNLEITSVEIKEEVGNVGWDQRNDRFAVIAEDQSTKRGPNVRFNVSFYDLSIVNRTIEIIKIHQLQNVLQNRVLLTKNGAFFACYNLSEDSPERGKFSLGYIVKEKEKKKYSIDYFKQNSMLIGMNVFSPDPSGRYLLMGSEKSYQIWTITGESLVRDTIKTVSNLEWRPRLREVLPEKEEKLLLEREKEIRKKYQEIDYWRNNKLKHERELARQSQKALFTQYITAKRLWYQQFVAERERILGFNDKKQRTETYEIVESIIEVQ